jgi:hypothetical protein
MRGVVSTDPIGSYVRLNNRSQGELDTEEETIAF